ncbi:response regulator transcription factor [Roseobacter sinensis]|uniref:Response regulator transcription factor n=1 Tax=Roseobacter sinensis TaxID=2931391 RepID=A0ABT3BHH7_9RHOB|nr:response regulator transcription factor [Roseobacter sp. WL0113]MCV3273031.1 response regulator transcription factor [Roseobacter sp. WL0113]
MSGTAAYRVSRATAGRAAVLCIEDDPIVQLMLDDIVGGAGGTCVIAGSAREAERHLAQEQYGLVVLDRRLPDSDGLLLMQNIKDSSNCPVIILSAMDDTRDRLLGIGLGAAEYVTKPFNPLELTSRIRQLLRARTEDDADKGVFETADLVFNPRSRQLEAGGQSTILAPAESRLLQALLTNAGEVQTRDQLSRAASGRDWTPGDRTIDVLINRLRRHLKNAPIEIKTVHRTGYFISLERKMLSKR